MAAGHSRQRGQTWQVIVHAGHDPVTDKRRNLTGTARTKRDAQALRARLLNRVNDGKRPASDATVAQLLARWLEVADLAWSTRVTYQATSTGRSARRSGRSRSGGWTPPPWTAFYTVLRVRGGVGATPPAPATVGQVHAIVRRALAQAARWGLDPRQPRGAGQPTPPRPGPADLRPPTPEDVSRLLAATYLADPDVAVLLWLAATTGARPGGAVRAALVRCRPGRGRAAHRAGTSSCAAARSWRRTPRPAPPAGSRWPTAAWPCSRSTGAAAPGGRRRAAHPWRRMPACAETRIPGC